MDPRLCKSRVRRYIIILLYIEQIKKTGCLHNAPRTAAIGIHAVSKVPTYELFCVINNILILYMPRYIPAAPSCPPRVVRNM